MNAKLIGGILLVVGTSIGAGMLALPVATAQGGFLGSLILLIGCWMLMTFGAFLILEVNMWLPADTNLVSMAKHSLGRWAEVISWLTYLLLLYSLLAAYLSGGSDVLSGIVANMGIDLPSQVLTVLFLLILGFVVFLGIRATDYVNRILMTIKFAALFILIVLIAPDVNIVRLTHIHATYLVSAITVVITSFGFATIVPSLRTYFNDDIQKLRKVIMIGSLIPLICYILWVAVILGEIPLKGAYGLIAILKSQTPTTALTNSLNHYLMTPFITRVAQLFTSICVATSFLGVSICMVDFLADGFGLKKQGGQKWLVFLATYAPPLILVFFFPSIFILSLSYAGIFCAILLVILPAMMAWRGRYAMNEKHQYQVFGGKWFLIIAIVLAFGVIIQELLLNFHIIS